MKSNLTKSIVLSSGLLLALTTLSACGKDKEVKANPPAQSKPTTPTESPTLVQSGDSTPAQNLPPVTAMPTTPAGPGQPLPGGTLVNPAPDQSGQQNQGLPTIPQAGPGRGGRGGQLPPVLPGIPNGTSTPQTKLPSVDQVNNQNPQKLPRLQVEETRAYQVDFTNQVAVKTGGLESTGLLYTSVGDDSLMEEFKSYNSKVSIDQQTKNNNLAKAIVNAKLSRSTVNGEMSIVLTLNEFGTMNTYRLVRNSNAQLNLTLSKAGTTGEMEFQGGFVKCLDLDGGCEVAYAKMKFSGGYTRVIFRNVADDLHFLIQTNVANNSAFSTWSNYIANSVNNAQTSQKIEGMKVSSFETVNGRAGAGAMLTTLDRQVIGFNIPMVVSATNSEVNVSVAKNADLSKSFDLPNLVGPYSVELSRAISAVRLVKNNGRGQFKLQLQFGSDMAPASIWLVGAGMQKKTIGLDQIRAFESSLRAF